MVEELEGVDFDTMLSGTKMEAGRKGEEIEVKALEGRG